MSQSDSCNIMNAPFSRASASRARFYKMKVVTYFRTKKANTTISSVCIPAEAHLHAQTGVLHSRGAGDVLCLPAAWPRS